MYFRPVAFFNILYVQCYICTSLLQVYISIFQLKLLIIMISVCLMISYISVVLKSIWTDASCIVLDFSVCLFGDEQFNLYIKCPI